MTDKPMAILLVEDNPADARLTREAFKTSKTQSVLTVVKDGVEAMDFLHQKGAYTDVEKPDLILLDLNLPRKDGREVLAEIKRDPVLRRIPVAVFTTSRAERDINGCYDLNANCYIVKPADLDQYFEAIRNTEQFWLSTVTRSAHE
jgi:chemotaxis family two-component system response regulator Rcp1